MNLWKKQTNKRFAVYYILTNCNLQISFLFLNYYNERTRTIQTTYKKLLLFPMQINPLFAIKQNNSYSLRYIHIYIYI